MRPMVKLAAEMIGKATGLPGASASLAEELEEAGLIADEPYGNFETVEEANAAGVFSGFLANGDTFGDEDGGPDGS